MADYLVTVQIMVLRTGNIKGGHHHVVHTSAAEAAEMVVGSQVGVEPGFATAVFKFFD